MWLLALLACGGVSSEDTAAPGTSTSTSPSTDPITLPEYDGTLEQARDHVLDALSAGRDTERWTAPTDAAIADFTKVGRRLSGANLDVAGLLEPHGYEALLVSPDNVVVVWESSGSTYTGAAMVALGDRRSALLEAPHSQFDSLTGLEAFDAFVALDARAWLVNTAHRCANAASTSCDGSTSACDGSSAPYRASDSAHNTQSLFQALHQGLMTGDASLVAVQLHGFSHDGSEPYAYISDGTTDDAGGSWLSNKLAADLSDRITAGTAASCNDPAAIHRLCGTSNTQGRQANNVVDACDTATTAATGRFLHIEQAKDLRDTSGAIHRGLLIDALDATLP